MPSPKDIVNSGNNLFAVAIVAAVALVGAPEVFTEGGVRGGLDDVAILAVATAGGLWYWRHRRAGSLVPLAVLGLSLIAKASAILIEDVDDRGDDFSVMAIIVVALLIWSAIYVRSRRATAAA
jgi:hypothetical protein